MKKIKLTRGLFTTVDDDDYHLHIKHKWCAVPQQSNKFRVQRKDKYNKSCYLHRDILKAKKGEFVDHIDGNPLNNCRSNLRLCTHHNNSFNQELRKNNTSGYKGVSKRKTNKYRAYIVINNRQISLGNNFLTKEVAAVAYNNAAIKYYKSFAKLNKVIFVP